MRSPKKRANATLHGTATLPTSQVDSVTQPPPSFRLPTPDDESASAAGSAAETPKTVRRTEAERIQVFKAHSACREIEPHRVLCARCNKWLSLGQRQTYALAPWEKHRERCDQKPPRTETQSPAGEEDVDDVASVNAPSDTHSDQAVRKTEAERKVILESDSRAEQVLPHEALCRKCQKWIKLSAKQSYSLGNWNRHQQKCSNAVPSTRVATAQRKLKLLNDPQAKSSTPTSVKCALCSDTITLDGEYILTKWDEHKLSCSDGKKSRKQDSLQAKKRLLASGVPIRARPAPLRNSEDALVAGSTSTGSPVRRGAKRPRESDAEIDEPEPASTRAKTENYVQPDQEAPSILGWFLMPFQTFISGFREGMSSSSAREIS